MRSKIISITLLFWVFTLTIWANESFRFALITDLHLQNGDNSVSRLQRVIRHINQSDSIDFVLVAGDLVEYADTSSLHLARRLIDHLQRPHYVVPGNHDTLLKGIYNDNYTKVFGNPHFSFLHRGIRFIGFSTAPHKIGKGSVGEGEFVFFNQLLRDTTYLPSTPTIALTHYPLLEGDVKNPDKTIQALGRLHTILVLCGHYHRNAFFSFQDILGIVNRAIYRTSDQSIGYNLYTIHPDNTIEVQEINLCADTSDTWLEYPIGTERL